MKRRGFTLIELLAVIVVLAIIAVIATPMVLNTIEDAKRGAFEQTLTNVKKAAELYQAKEEMSDSLADCRYFSFGNDVTEIMIRDNKTYYPVKDLNLKGNLPTEGEVKICSDVIAIEASNGSYSGSLDGDKFNVVEGDLASNDLTTPVIAIFNTTATVDRIIVSVSAYSQSVGGVITNYYYKINDGDYIKTTESGYIFDDLDSNTEYTITIKVENKSGITKEESKTVTTKAFGEITIDVSDADKWTSSKEVTITGTTEEFTIEYMVEKYNIETGVYDTTDFITYTEPFTLDTVATSEYQTKIRARYKSGDTYSNWKSYVVEKIDPTAPTTTMPAVNVSTAKPTSEASVVIRQADSESGLNEETIEYGYSTDNKTYTWQSSSTLQKLTSGKKYYIKTRVTNNVGKQIESETAEYTPGTISTCSVKSLTSGWATSKDVQISGSQTGTILQYQVGSTDSDKWKNIENNGTINITENTTVYCRLWDETSEGTYGQGTVSQIDTGTPTAPTITGGSTSWSSVAKTISVATESSSDSGIDHYQYCISTSTSSCDGTWKDLAQGVKSVSISTNGTRYIYMRGVNTVGTEGTVSSYQTTMIDTGTATAPTITGGSTSWSSAAKTISVSKESSSTSGINHYQYCISTSTNSCDGTWTDLAQGVKNVSISTNGTRYIYMRAVNGTGTPGTASAYQTTKIDTTSPSAPSITSSVNNGSSITLNFSVGSDSESDITTHTCEYGTSSGLGSSVSVSGTATSCTFTTSVGQYYAYRVCATNGVSKQSCTSISSLTTFTGIASGTYTAGSTVSYGGLSWKVIKDNGSNVTLISAGNYANSAFNNNSSTDWSTAAIKSIVTGNFVSAYSAIQNDINRGGIVYNSTSGSYVRLPYQSELSSNIANTSGTNFWTMSSYSSMIYYGLPDGTNSYKNYSLTPFTYYQGYGSSSAIMKTIYTGYSSPSKTALALPTVTAAPTTTSILSSTTSDYYATSSNTFSDGLRADTCITTSQAYYCASSGETKNPYVTLNGCGSSGTFAHEVTSTWNSGAAFSWATKDTCARRTVYTVQTGSTAMGVRPVITVKER